MLQLHEIVKISFKTTVPWLHASRENQRKEKTDRKKTYLTGVVPQLARERFTLVVFDPDQHQG
jgi:hypothetical protein